MEDKKYVYVFDPGNLCIFEVLVPSNIEDEESLIDLLSEHDIDLDGYLWVRSEYKLDFCEIDATKPID